MSARDNFSFHALAGQFNPYRLDEAAMRQKKNQKQSITPVSVQFRAFFKKEYTINSKEVNRIKKLYQHHLRLLKLQGKSQKTIDAYSRAVHRISDHFDCCSDKFRMDKKIRALSRGKFAR